MRVVWLCNVLLPQISEQIHVKRNNLGGWLTGLSTALVKDPDIQLYFIAPAAVPDAIEGKAGEISYTAYPASRMDRLEEFFAECIHGIHPDVIHVFGTEFPSTSAMMNASERCGMLNQTVVSIQGLVSVYAEHYCDGLPDFLLNMHTIRAALKGNAILKGQQIYVQRGESEKAALRKCRNVIGRTKWDKEETAKINPSRKY